MNNREMENWLKTLPVLTEVKGEMEIALMEQLGGKALTGLLGLLLGARQAFYAQLSGINLGDRPHRHTAAVIQGKIQGIELVINTMRELAVRSSSETDNDQQRSQ